MSRKYRGKRENDRGKEEGSRDERGISRREFLGKTVRGTGAAVSATAYAGVGGFLGTVYGGLRDFLNYLARGFEKLERDTGNALYSMDQKYDRKIAEMKKSDNPAVKAAGETGGAVKGAEDWRQNMWGNIFGRTKEDQRKYREEKKVGEYQQPEKPKTEYPASQPDEKKSDDMTRRGFFASLLGLANENPATTGMIVGGAYGAKKAYSNLQKSAVARDTRGLRKEVRGLRRELDELRPEKDKPHEKPRDLGDKMDRESGSDSDFPDMFIALGLFGILVSAVLGVLKFTGFFIFQEGIKVPIIWASIFFLSLVFLSLGIFKKRKRLKYTSVF